MNTQKVMNAQELINILAQHPDAEIRCCMDEYTSKISSCKYFEEYNIFVLS